MYSLTGLRSYLRLFPTWLGPIGYTALLNYMVKVSSKFNGITSFTGHHYGHGIYPFASHWPTYSPGNGSSSSSGKSSPPTGAPTSIAKTSATSHATTSSSHSGLGLNWWHPPDMHHFSSPPWSSHEHRESHGTTRDSGPSMFHGTRARNGPQYYTAAHHNHGHIHGHSHGHSYHHGRSSHLHGSTLIHFPHSSSHQSVGSKDESPSTEHSSPNRKEKAEQKAGFAVSSESHERERGWDDVPKLHNRHDTFSPHLRLEKPVNYNRRAEGTSDDEGKDPRSPNEEQRFEEHEKADRLVEEKSQLHRMPYEDRPRGSVASHSGRSENRVGHDSKLAAHPSNPLYISSVSEKALASAKASYLNKDANERGYVLHAGREEQLHSPYPFSSPREKDVNFSKAGIISPNAHDADNDFDQKRDYHLAKHEHHRDLAQYRDASSGGLQSERMNRAEATREWVNKQPALHISSSFEQYVKQESRCKTSDASPLNRKIESPKTSAAKIGKSEKCSKKEQHYESPLNSNLPRYSAGHAVQAEMEKPEPVPQKRGKNPFNVDFLSVSSDTESHPKRDMERHYHASLSQENSSDRVSVIKSPLAMPTLSREPQGQGLDGARSHLNQQQSREVNEKGCLNRASSLLDSPLPPKPVPPLSGKPRSFMRPDNLSVKNSDSETSSEEESCDQIEEEEDSSKHVTGKEWKVEQNGTENDGKLKPFKAKVYQNLNKIFQGTVWWSAQHICP